MKLLTFLILTSSSLIYGEDLIDIYNNYIHFNLNLKNNVLTLTVTKDHSIKLQGKFARHISNFNFTSCGENCIKFDESTLYINITSDNEFDVFWSSKNPKNYLEDCFKLDQSNNVHWYGGPKRREQIWPIEKLQLDNYVNVPQENSSGSITEPYWLNSLGAYVFIKDKVPLFIDQNIKEMDYVCFSARNDHPYIFRNELNLQYSIGIFEDPKQAHLSVVQNHMKKPTGYPNVKMIENPIWSTWARYSQNINDDVLMSYANDILKYNYKGGLFEIDDKWEDCYGSFRFDTKKFGRIKETVATIKEMGFRVALYVHPFVNSECKEFADYGLKNGYFVGDTNGNYLTSWWNTGPKETYYLDFTKKDARLWFISRLNLLKEETGIDTFKIDAGETTWAPQPSILQGEIEDSPNLLTKDFARTCEEFGDSIQIRTGWRTQDLTVFIQMMDKDSRWGSDNGLYTLIPTLLQMNMNGYTMFISFVTLMPDAELFIRWLQANSLMPSLQFSFAPWDFINQTSINVLKISEKYVQLHKDFLEIILEAMNNSINFGHPVNPPIWWVDPENEATHGIDTQYLLGENVLVAPILNKGETSRNIYLPRGKWIDANTREILEGRQLIKNYPAPVEVLPYFVRAESKAAKLLKNIN